MQRRGNRSALAKALRANRIPLPANARNHVVSGLEATSAADSKKQTRVQLYLPIADIPVNVFLILAMGAAVCFVSGMFGIGGGFLMKPLLIFVGIAPAVAVGSVAHHIPGASVSAAIYFRRRPATDSVLS